MLNEMQVLAVTCKTLHGCFGYKTVIRWTLSFLSRDQTFDSFPTSLGSADDLAPSFSKQLKAVEHSISCGSPMCGRLLTCSHTCRLLCLDADERTGLQPLPPPSVVFWILSAIIYAWLCLRSPPLLVHLGFLLHWIRNQMCSYFSHFKKYSGCYWFILLCL